MRKRIYHPFLIVSLLFLIFSFFYQPVLSVEEEKCSHCGELIDKESAFCSFCGAKLKEIYKKKELPTLEEILNKGKKSIFCVSALHHRWLYDALGDKDLITHLLGTAYLIKPGYALTDLAIVEGAKEVKLIDHEGKSIPCTIHGKDNLYGFAVLKLEDKKRPPLEMGLPENIKVGLSVYAIGYPSAKGEAKVGATMGKGIIGAVERSGMGLKQYENFIQTDVPFSDGMCGAPLLDQEGRIVGMIVMRLYSRGFFTKFAASVGFASPVHELMSAVEKVIEGKKEARGWLGMTLGEIKNHPDDDMRLTEEGIYAEFIIPGSPSEKAGLQNGDILVSLNDQKIDKIHAFQEKIFSASPGEKIQLKIKNKQGSKSLEITLGQRPDKIRLSCQDMVYLLSGLKFEADKKGHLVVSYIRKGSIAYNSEIEKGHRLDDIFVKKDYKSEKEDYDYFNVRSWEDFEKVVNRGFSDYDFLAGLRFKEKNERGLMKKVFIYGFQQDFPSA
jgi:S1-C subfamily serine protease